MGDSFEISVKISTFSSNVTKIGNGGYHFYKIVDDLTWNDPLDSKILKWFFKIIGKVFFV